MAKKRLKNLFYISMFIVLLLALFLVLTVKQPSFDQSQPLLFYSQQCPHCKNVEKFIKQHQVEQYVTINTKSIDKNASNIKTLVVITKKCKLPTDKILIPLFWNGKKCLVGDTAIIQYLKQKIAQN